jgi:hypothetical protein
MVYYLQRERRLAAAIPNDSILKFDAHIALSETKSLTPSEDFQYQEDGSIDIVRPGTYIIFWFVAGMTGYATAGQSYQLKKIDYDAPDPEWTVLAGASNHIKVSSIPGFGTVVVSKEEISEHGKATIALFNTADSEIQLTFFHPKAGILIFGLDIESLENRITTIEQEITKIFQRILILEQFIFLSDVTELWSPTIALSGLGSGVIHAGYTYNFWGIGALDHQQTLNNGTTYYLIRSSQYPELMLYQGDTTISTLWIETPGGDVHTLPVRFDETGIYFRPNSQITNLPIGTTFKFTQALILVDPSEP